MAHALRICHLGKYYPPAPGGIETHVQTLARAQVKLGADVRVLCVNHANSAGDDVTWARFGATSTVEEIDDGVRVLRLGRRASVARFDVCPRLPREMDELFRDSIDILHLQTPNPTMLLAVAMMRKRVPIVVTHQSDVIKQRVLRHALAPFERIVYHRATRLLSSSEAYVEGSSLLKRYRSKVEAVPLGLNLSNLLNPSARAKTHAAAWRTRLTGPMWLAVGRCVYYKGLEIAIEALRNVPGTLVIIGTGPLQRTLQDLASRIGVADRVIWQGYADRDELIGAYRAANALWFPSTHRSEAFGLVQVEAMASGCPVINTAIPYSGVNWVSRDNESGLTVPINDSVAFAVAARRLLDEPGLRDRLSAGAKARAINEFDDQLMARRTLEVYQSAVDAHNAIAG